MKRYHRLVLAVVFSCLGLSTYLLWQRGLTLERSIRHCVATRVWELAP